MKGVFNLIQKLKPKEQLFCYYYAKLRNSKEAAIKAGFNCLIAERQGDKLLMESSIITIIEQINSKIQDDNLTQCVISGLKRLAFSTTNDSVKLMFTNRDDMKKIIDELDLFHVSEIKMPKENSIEVKFFDRFKALEKLSELALITSNKDDALEFYKALESSAASINENGGFDEI